MKPSLRGGSEEGMRYLLDELPDLVNRIFDVLDLLVVRVALLGLAALGAYSLLNRRRSGRPLRTADGNRGKTERS